MRALPGGCIVRRASRRGVYQVGCQGNGGGKLEGDKGEGARHWFAALPFASKIISLRRRKRDHQEKRGMVDALLV